MAAYVVANFTITNEAGYEAYRPGVLPTLMAAGAEVLVADYDTKSVEGAAGKVTVIVKFPSRAAAEAWYHSPEYQKVITLRTDNSVGHLTIHDQFVMP